MFVRFFPVILVALLLAACAGEPQQQTLTSDPRNTPLEDPNSKTLAKPDDPVSTSTGNTSTVTETGQTATGFAPGSAEDFKNTTDDKVFFETNKYFISDDSARVLRQQAMWLRKFPDKHLLIEGHCDERGTREYNYALGNRRAFAVRDFLISQGIASYRIKTVSYGKDKPEFVGANETAWKANRRAVTAITR